MKTIVLLITGMLFGITTVAADINPAPQGEDLNVRFYYDQPITFIERGIEFLVFPDGSFDFNTQLNTTSGDGYYRKATTRRSSYKSINRTFGAPGTYTYYGSVNPRPVIVTHDRDGKVRRVGNVFINYNREDQLKRVGSVYLRYNRRGLLTQVGGLRIHYNRHGISHISGHVNRYNTNCGVCGIRGCGINHFDGHHNPNHNNETHYNDDYHYYKKGGKTKKVKKIRRK